MDLIDWKEILKGYNIHLRNGKNPARTIKEMLHLEYRKQKSIRRVGKVLGISYQTVLKKMDEKGVKRELRPRGISKEKIFLSIPDEKLEKMTVEEISGFLGIKENYANQLLSTYRRKCKKEGREDTIDSKIRKIPLRKLDKMKMSDLAMKLQCSVGYCNLVRSRMRNEYMNKSFMRD